MYVCHPSTYYLACMCVTHEKSKLMFAASSLSKLSTKKEGQIDTDDEDGQDIFDLSCPS